MHPWKCVYDYEVVFSAGEGDIQMFLLNKFVCFEPVRKQKNENPNMSFCEGH